MSGDYTLQDLVKVLNISRATASRCLTGRYNIGKAVRFRREDIDFVRGAGKKIEVRR